MKMITMWKKYYSEVYVPTWNWVKRYWKEYLLQSLVIGVGVSIYYNILFNKNYR